MKFRKITLRTLIPLLIVFSNSYVVHAQHLHLKVAGDTIQGFHVDVYNGSQLLITNTEEFSLELTNNDLSTIANISQWKGQSWSVDENEIVLQRDTYVNEFDANLSVSVSYKVMSDNIIRKTIELFQPSMPDMAYILKETAKPAKKPSRYVT